MKPRIILFLLMSIFIMSCSQQKKTLKPEQRKKMEDKLSQLSVIPKPMEMKRTDGEFVINDSTKLLVVPGNRQPEEVADYFKKMLKKSSGYDLPVQTMNASTVFNNAIVFNLIENKDIGAEGYSLFVKPDLVTIAANAPAGLFYGVQTLRQLLPIQIESEELVTGKKWKIPCVEIIDAPRFQWRGAHLDVCRHFFPKEFVKKYIDILALHKMNTFHWHLTEDQGWRIEIKKYPKLTEVGAWRVDRSGVTWRDRQPQQPGEAATYGGYYTQEDVKEIVAYAKSRFIQVVPEIEMPGHALAAIAAYPEYSCFGGPFTVATGGYWPIKDIYCAGKEGTFEFLENILDEVIPLFPGEFFHIGGDEAFKENWEKCPDCQKRITDEGLKDVHELQSYFIKRIEKILNSRGKRLVGWDEILEGGLAPNATVMSWRGVAGGIEAANAGHDVVMSPTSHCYFDYYQAREGEPEAIGGYLPLEKVYSFEPVPPDIDPEKEKHILGAQANVWTEYIPTPEHAEYMLLPRLSALSEVVWSPKEARNLKDFHFRMQSFYERLTEMQINFRIPTPLGFGGERTIFGETVVELENPLSTGEIRYTLDGSDPGEGSLLYGEPIKITGDAEIKSRIFLDNGKMSSLTTEKIFLVNKKKNGLRFKYYEGRWEKLPDFGNLKIKGNGRCYSFDLKEARQREEFYGVVFSGFLKLKKKGEYTFYTISDDGSKLYVDGKLVVDNDGFHGAQEESGSIELKSGSHKITVEYFESSGTEKLEVLYKGPGIEKQKISPASFFYKK